jgi:hypothetical protein
MNLMCNNSTWTSYMVLYAYVMCLRILASLRMPRYDLGRRTQHFWGVSVTLGPKAGWATTTRLTLGGKERKRAGPLGRTRPISRKKEYGLQNLILNFGSRFEFKSNGVKYFQTKFWTWFQNRIKSNKIIGNFSNLEFGFKYSNLNQGL